MAHEGRIKDEIMKALNEELSEETHNIISINLTSDQLEEVAEKCASRVINLLSDAATKYLLNYVK